MRYDNSFLISTANELWAKLNCVLSVNDWERETKIEIEVVERHFRIRLDNSNNGCACLRMRLPDDYEFRRDEYKRDKSIVSKRAPEFIPEYDYKVLESELRGDYWKNFLTMANIPPYDCTRIQVIAKAKELVNKKRAKKITPELWNSSLAAVIKYFDSWAEFERAVRTTEIPDVVKDTLSSPEDLNTPESIIMQIIALKKELARRFGLKLSITITDD